MGKELATAALGIGSSIAEGVGNMIFGEFNQRQQLRGQKKALEQQNAAQLDMWNKTNYGAQVKHMKEAGLNPALMYGMGGGGGVTAGSGSASVQGGQAGMGISGGIQAAAQLKLLQAQERNLNADSANKEANARKTAGVDTEKTIAEIGNVIENTNKLKAEVKTEETKQALNSITAALNKQQWDYNDRTMEARIEGTVKTMETIGVQLDILKNQKDISDATKDTQIKQYAATLANTLADTAVKEAGVQVAYQNIEESKARMQNMIEQIIVAKWHMKHEGYNVKIAEARLAFEKEWHNLTDEEKAGMEWIMSQPPIERAIKGQEWIPKGQTKRKPIVVKKK